MSLTANKKIGLKTEHLLKSRVGLRGLDCTVLHCASLLRTIFASFVCANERGVTNEITFPQAKLDSELSARFPFNNSNSV